MQNAKDTFYEVVRGRLAAINPRRTVALRGVVRPAVLVEENELPSSATLPECFHLSWGDTKVDLDGALPCVTLCCEIEYETAGSAESGGMDRGRTLAAMDAELLTVFALMPTHAPKMNFAGLATGGAATRMETDIWWGQPTFGALQTKNGTLRRAAGIAVMSYQEAGEL